MFYLILLPYIMSYLFPISIYYLLVVLLKGTISFQFLCYPGSIIFTQTFNSYNNVIVGDIWHHRLGHPSFSKLETLKPVLNISNLSSDQHCPICHLSKHRRLPFSNSVSKSTTTFDLVHCDIWGPFIYPTCEG